MFLFNSRSVKWYCAKRIVLIMIKSIVSIGLFNLLTFLIIN